MSDSLTMEQLRDRYGTSETRRALLAAQLRSRGYVPDAERGANAVPVIAGPTMDRLASLASGDGLASGIGHPAAEVPRFGASVGGFSYDTQSPAAQLDQAKIGAQSALDRLRSAQAQRIRSRLPADDARERLIAAGNDESDVDAALATGDPVALRRLLQPDPVAVYDAKRDYAASHPVGRSPSAAVPRESAEHRDARQGFSAVRAQVTDADHELGQMDRTAPPLVQYPGLATGSAADSAAARRFTATRDATRARRDSLRSVADRFAAQMTRPAASNDAMATPSSRPPLTPAQRQRAAMNPDYREFLTERGYRF